MRNSLLLFPLAAFLSVSASAENYTGKFSCEYTGDWACGKEGICIDSAGARKSMGKVTLLLDLDQNRAELNGIGGMIARDSSLVPTSLSWRLTGLGTTKFKIRLDGNRPVALILDSSRMMSSEFLCEPQSN